MKFAVNHSHESLDLLDSGQVSFDLVKLPGWPELVSEVAAKYPCYVHFPLKVGRGIGVIDNEDKAPVAWDKIDRLMELTGTKLVNLHVTMAAKHFPAIPKDSMTGRHFEHILDGLLKDVEEAAARYGPENVMIENEHAGKGQNLRINIMPELYHRVIDTLGVGLLLDISHARIAARHIGEDEKTYISSLPVKHIRELHVTGLQWFGDAYINKVRNAGMDEKWIGRIAYSWMDHLPMTDEDWPVIDWAAGQIRSGTWSSPTVAAFEYGGTGPFFGTFSDRATLAGQISRLEEVFRNL